MLYHQFSFKEDHLNHTVNHSCCRFILRTKVSDDVGALLAPVSTWVSACLPWLVPLSHMKGRCGSARSWVDSFTQGDCGRCSEGAHLHIKGHRAPCLEFQLRSVVMLKSSGCDIRGTRSVLSVHFLFRQQPLEKTVGLLNKSFNILKV